MAPGNLKNDPRPLADKQFVRNNIETVIRYLSEHNYDQAISPKILHRPTGKDFENILMFLFRQVDPNWESSGKFADDVIQCFKALRYPFNISKTALAAVGSPHTWPALLASLSWLVEILDFGEVTGLCHSEMESAEEYDLAKWPFFSYFRQAYKYFLCGDDERSNVLHEEFMASFEGRHKIVEEQFLQSEGIMKDLKSQLEGEAGVESRIPELELRKRDFQSDKVKWEQFIKQCERNKEVLEAKLKEKDLEYRAREEDLEEAEMKKAKIQKILDNQEVNPVEADRMNQERRQLEESHNRLLEHKDEIQKSIWETDMQVSKLVQEIEQVITGYNHTAKQLRLTQSDKDGIAFNLKLDVFNGAILGCSNTGATQMADVDTIKEALESLNEVAVQKTQQIQTENIEIKLKADENGEEKDAIESEIFFLEQKLTQVESKYQEDKRRLEAELSNRATETELIEEEIHRLQTQITSLKLPVFESEQRLIRLELEFENCVSSHAQYLQETDEDIHNRVEEFVSYKEEVGQTLESMEKYLKSRIEEIGETYQEALTSFAL